MTVAGEDPRPAADGSDPIADGSAAESDGPGSAADDAGPESDGPGSAADDADPGTAHPPHDAEFCFEYPDERRARLVADAVGNEVGEIDDDRSRARIAREGRRVTVTVAAADLVALRAATNTWLGLVDVAERTAELAEAHR